MILSSDLFDSFGESILTAIFVFVFLAGMAAAVGIICVNIMKKKGYDMLAGWFFIGFFLGLIGLVICLCIEDKTKQIPPSPFEQYVNPKPQYDHENGAQCPQCGMTNPIGARFCNCCGNKLR